MLKHFIRPFFFSLPYSSEFPQKKVSPAKQRLSSFSAWIKLFFHPLIQFSRFESDQINTDMQNIVSFSGWQSNDGVSLRPCSPSQSADANLFPLCPHEWQRCQGLSSDTHDYPMIYTAKLVLAIGGSGGDRHHIFTFQFSKVHLSVSIIYFPFRAVEARGNLLMAKS